MKTSLSLILLFAVFFFSACGDDDNSPEQVMPTEKDVYAAGVIIKDGVGRATWWKNGTETIVSDGTHQSSVFDMWVDNSDVYLCGIVNKGTNLATYWKNGVEVSLDDDYSSAKAIVVSNGDVYVAGTVFISNKTAATVWKNGEPQQISDASSSEIVNDMFVQNTDVYVAGIANNGGKQVATYWKNNTKIFLSDEITVATKIFISGNDVYVSGWENKGGVYRACYWKNGNIIYLTDGTHAAEAHGIFVSGNDVHVSGRENNIATYWKNGTPARVFRNGGLENALLGADLFIGVSVGGIVSEEMVRSMAKDTIVMAMANPVPEIMPDAAKRAGARIIATGRSDFPNQLNNCLSFPGVFKGALSTCARKITPEMEMAAAHALAEVVTLSELSEDYIIPDPLDRRVVPAVSKAVAGASLEGCVARKSHEDQL